VPGEVTINGDRSHVRNGHGRGRNRCNWRDGSRRIGSAIRHRITRAQGDFNSGMSSIHQDVPSVYIVHVYRIGVQPGGRPRISETEPESAELEAGLTADHRRMADVKLMITTEVGAEAIVRNVSSAVEISAAAVVGSVPELATSTCISVSTRSTVVRDGTMSITTCGPRIARTGRVGSCRAWPGSVSVLGSVGPRCRWPTGGWPASGCWPIGRGWTGSRGSSGRWAGGALSRPCRTGAGRR